MINYYLVQFIPNDLNDYDSTEGPVFLGIYDLEGKAQQYISSQECSSDLKKRYLTEGHIEIIAIEFDKPFNINPSDSVINEYWYNLNEGTVRLINRNIISSSLKPIERGVIYASNEEEALGLLKQFKETECVLKLTGFFNLETNQLWFETMYLHTDSTPRYKVDVIQRKDKPTIRSTFRYVWLEDSYSDKKGEIIKDLTLGKNFIEWEYNPEDLSKYDSSFETQYS